MKVHILSTRISGTNLVLLRDRTRQVGELFGLDKMQCTRFITAVSEIARNTVQHAGEGMATFIFCDVGARGQQLLAEVADRGPGIADLPAVLAGRPNPSGRVPLGIAGSTRLVDELRIECPPAGGTVVTLTMSLPKGAPRLSSTDITARVGQLAQRKPQTPLETLEQQNRDMLFTLEELRVRKIELEQADLRKNQFLSTLAHELRNPLGTLHMTLELLRRKPGMDAAELARRHGVMTRQTEQLTRLVNDLMDASRVSLGKVTLERQPAEVNLLVSEAVEMTGAALQAKAHVVTVTLSDGELWIEGDQARLKQVLCNLIQNAARYTPDHGQIAITVRSEPPYAVVEVADNGIGIAPDILPHVFGLFVQGATGEESKGGLGVGLCLVQRLTQDHGGTVAAASAGLGHGSRFTVTLPLAAATGEAQGIAVQAPAAAIPAAPAQDRRDPPVLH